MTSVVMKDIDETNITCAFTTLTEMKTSFWCWVMNVNTRLA